MYLGLITVVVSEYDPAITFFTDVLGFELVEDSPSLTNDGRPKRWVVVRPPGARPRERKQCTRNGAQQVSHDVLPELRLQV